MQPQPGIFLILSNGPAPRSLELYMSILMIVKLSSEETLSVFFGPLVPIRPLAFVDMSLSHFCIDRQVVG